MTTMLSSSVSSTKSARASLIFKIYNQYAQSSLDYTCRKTHMDLSLWQFEDKSNLCPLKLNIFLQCRSLDRHHSLQSSVCNCLQVWNRVEGSCRAVVFSGRLFLCWSHASELWCLGWCWMIQNESIISWARVEQPDSLSSQRYHWISLQCLDNHLLKENYLLQLVQTSFN